MNVKSPVLVAGNYEHTFGIIVCLLQADHSVTLFTRSKLEAFEYISSQYLDIFKQQSANLSTLDNLKIIDHFTSKVNYNLAIVITNENLSHKKSIIRELEDILPYEATITVNTESIALSIIQEDTTHPERIIGANWAEPVYNSYFLEIITNEKCNEERVNKFSLIAKSYWNKDPYVLRKDNGIRSKLMCALIREAFYLIVNGYVTVTDIDRACRNDPGYYAAYAGICKYMDLMGTYGYGIVMKDINPELSKETNVPSFFMDIIRRGGLGMKNGKGLYTYLDDEVKKYREFSRNFSYEIHHLISKYSDVEGSSLESKKHLIHE